MSQRHSRLLQIICCNLFMLLPLTTHAETFNQLQSAIASNTNLSDLDLSDEETVALDMNSVDSVPVEEIRRFVELYQTIKSNYINQVSDETLFDNALHGIVSRLDPYSEYLDAEQYQDLIQFTDGASANVGISLNPDNQQGWKISSVLVNSPAEKVGIVPGQQLYKIDGQDVSDLKLADIEKKLLGKAGTLVDVTVGKYNFNKKTYHLQRAQFEAMNVKVRLQYRRVLVLQIPAFQANTALQTQRLISNAITSSKISAVILDLRDNPGGLLSSAVEVANLFLDKGLIVSTQGRMEAARRFQASAPDYFPNIQLGILQNRTSASAAEVLTAALQDHKRATVFGEPSYGKGVVQKIIGIDRGKAIKLTVSQYLTPKNQMIEGLGVKPDIPYKAVKNSLISDDPMLNQAVSIMQSRAKN